MRVLIVGGGITGLSAAWFIQKKHPSAKITLFEKENRLGGWVETSAQNGFLFEKGPRVFPISKSPHLLKLIAELGLEILESNPLAKQRYILCGGKLKTPFSLLPRFLFPILREYFTLPSQKEDESIFDFAVRRFSPKVAELVFDPLTLGIYAGDIRKLSLRSCFPALHKWEQEKGSVIRGFLSAPKSPRGLFTLKGGMETLIHALEKKLQMEVLLNCAVEKIENYSLIAAGKIWHGDKIISALPPLLPKKSLSIVHLAYSGNCFPKKGFGYLVPTSENEMLLGALFDSAIFPEHFPKGTSCITAMVRIEESQPLETAQRALEKHLKIHNPLIYSAVHFAKEAIPQPEVGSGFFEGVSVDACVQRGEKLSKIQF